MTGENATTSKQEDNAAVRPMKNPRGARTTSKLARPIAATSSKILPAKRPAGSATSRKPQAIQDDVFLTRQTAVLDEEVEEEVNQDRKKRVKVELEEEVKPPKDAGWVDLDDGDEDDPLMVSEYVNEVYEYLIEKEVSDAFDASPDHPALTTQGFAEIQCRPRQLHGHSDRDHLEDARYPCRLAHRDPYLFSPAARDHLPGHQHC